MTNIQRLRRCCRVLETNDPLRLVIVYKQHLRTSESKFGKCRDRLAVHVFSGRLTRQHSAWKVRYYLEVVRRRFVDEHVVVQSLNNIANKLLLLLLLFFKWPTNTKPVGVNIEAKHM